MYHDTEYLMARGIAAVNEGNKAEARTWFEMVVEIDAENAEALLWLGGLADDPKLSMTYLEQALQLDPENRYAKEGLKWARSRQQRHQDQAAPAVPSGDAGDSAEEHPLQRWRTEAVPRVDFDEAPRARRRLRASPPLIMLLASALVCIAAVIALVATQFPLPVLAQMANRIWSPSDGIVTSAPSLVTPGVAPGESRAAALDELARVKLTATRETAISGLTDMGLYMMGLLSNEGTMEAEEPEVTALLKNAEGDVIATQSGRVLTERVAPGQLAPFEVIFPEAPDSWASYEIRAHGWPSDTGGGPVPVPRITEQQAWRDWDGAFRVSGEVVNDTGLTLENVRLIVAMYDERGLVSTLATRSLFLSHLEAGETEPFDLSIQPLLGPVTGYSLWLSAQPVDEGPQRAEAQ